MPGEASDDNILPPTPLERLERRFPSPGYQLTRFLLLRLLGLVYGFAFLGLVNQLPALLGERGLTPAALFLQRVDDAGLGFARLPTLFWAGASDATLMAAAVVGLLLSLALLAGFANAISLFVLWFLYLSFVHVGQEWFAFGWEIQLCETGFLAVFLAPLLDPRPFPARPPSRVVIFLFRWLSFRILLGAGLIKWRGDACWHDLSCLDTHFETQPVPSPLSPLFHAAPGWVHASGVLFNHVVELVAPWCVFGPRRLRLLAAVLAVLFQVALILSGNLAFLNWLTLVPIVACFDDRFLARLIPARWWRPTSAPIHLYTTLAAGVLALLVGVLSVDVVANLASPRQRMNHSFDPFELVNTYGAFGSVDEERLALVFEGTDEQEVTADTVWREYQLPCAPGDPARRPCLLGPYHRRLDWLIWFAWRGGPGDYPWMVEIAVKLLRNDRTLLGQFAGNPFPLAPPRWIRVVRYRYHMEPPTAAAWWRRERVPGLWLRPIRLGDPEVEGFLLLNGLAVE